MSRYFILCLLFSISAAIAATPGTVKIGVFEDNKVAVELAGEGAKEVAEMVRSSKNISCENEVCRFEFDSNFKASKTKLNLENALRKDQYYFYAEAEDNGLKLSTYSANGDPNRGTLVRNLYQLLVEESKRPGNKVKGQAITNHDYAYEGIHLRCTGFVSGDYLCEMKVNRKGFTRN